MSCRQEPNDVCLLTLYRSDKGFKEQNSEALYRCRCQDFNGFAIRQVQSYSENRLLCSKGNINLTDAWYEMTALECKHDESYSIMRIPLFRQNISKLKTSDIIKDHECKLGIIFLQVDILSEPENRLHKIIKKMKCNSTLAVYRTLDNMDYVILAKVDSINSFKQLIDAIHEGEFTLLSYSVLGYHISDLEDPETLENPICPSNICYDNEKVGWCKYYKQIMEKSFQSLFPSGNEALLSLYQALMQTLNTLSLYEDFYASNDIFDIYLPSFDLLIKTLLDTKIFEINSESKIITSQNEKPCENLIENEVCKKRLMLSASIYLETVHMLIQRQIRSEQRFFTVPGCGRDLYEIPTKLILFYTAFMYDIISIMKDVQEYTYRFIIHPIVHTILETELLDIGYGKQKRLIMLSASQRFLFAPRSFLMISVHEMAHYVGQYTRGRELRFDIICDILYNVITAYINRNIEFNIKKYEVLSSLWKKHETFTPIINKIELTIKRCINKMRDKILKSNNGLYSYELEMLFARFIPALYIDIEKWLPDAILGFDYSKINDIFLKEITWRELSNLVDKVLLSVKILFYDGNLLLMERKICTDMKELYADISMLQVLDQASKWENYMESMQVSEGTPLRSSSQIDESLLNRMALVVSTFSQKNIKSKNAWEKLLANCSSRKKENSEKNSSINKLVEMVEKMRKTVVLNDQSIEGTSSINDCVHENENYPEFQYLLYGLQENKMMLFEYCMNIYDKIQIHINNINKCADKNRKLSRIRRIFASLENHKLGKDTFGNEFFYQYDELIREYEKERVGKILAQTKDELLNEKNA